MKTKTVTVDGRELPCRLTMGAMLRYKRETGQDVSELNGKDLAAIGALIWCCVKSACAADGIEMELGMDDFLDRIDADKIPTLEGMTGIGAGEEEKKTLKQESASA